MGAYREHHKMIGEPDRDEVLFIDDKPKNIHWAAEFGYRIFLFPSREVTMDEAFEQFIQHLKNMSITE